MAEDVAQVQKIVRRVAFSAGAGAMSTRSKSDVLAENTFGIVSGDADVQDKLLRMVALVPMALEVVDEARDTIQRLRTEVETLRAEVETLRAERDAALGNCDTRQL
ncbi:MAG: hypothetical protein ABI255_03870 [Microbacteriaceae bacterium]